MSKQTKSGQWADLGTVRQRKNKDGNLVSYIVLNEGVTVTVQGKEIDLGKYRTVSLVNPMNALDALLEGGHISESEHENRAKFLKDKMVKYKITVPPTNNE